MNGKKSAADKAVTYIKNGMTVGLGTGSTSLFAIQNIGSLVQHGLHIKAVASSVQTEKLAREHSIPLTTFDVINGIDIYIDGADEVDAHHNLIKGGGGALVREKILAFNSRQFLVIVDESKKVDKLGALPLPVEVVPFACQLTLLQLQKLGCSAQLRKRDGATFISDNGNYILDCHFGVITDPVGLDRALHAVPGVVETGLFPAAMVTQVIVGGSNGQVLKG